MLRVVRRPPPGVGRASVLAALVLGGCETSASGQLAAELVAEIDARLEAFVAAPMVPGVAVGIVVDDELAYARGFGVADRERGRPVRATSVFQIGSTSKSFTTTLLGILAERGLVGWDDPVTRHLAPDVVYPVAGDRPATLRQLAGHTAGLPRDPPMIRRAHGDAPVLAFTHFELYRSIETARLAFPPDSGWSYSNFGFAVLGHALERASGKPYEVLLFDEIFAPLGMLSSTVTLWPRFDTLLARPYYPNDRTGTLDDYTPWDSEAMAPAGGLASNVPDLARYLRLHLGGRVGTRSILSAATLERLHRPERRIDGTLSYGLGWFSRELAGVGRIYEHGGEVDGYTSFLGFSAEHGVGVVVLKNAGDGPLGELADWIFTRVVASR